MGEKMNTRKVIEKCLGKNQTYKVIKYSQDSGRQKVMERNLSLDEAQRYCSRPDTKGKGWFCGFTKEE